MNIHQDMNIHRDMNQDMNIHQDTNQDTYQESRYSSR